MTDSAAVVAEAFWRRRQLNHFLDSEPAWVQLNRPTKEATLSGGVRQTGVTTFPPQRFRIIPFKRRLTMEFEISTQGETVRNIHYILLGDPEADVQLGDYFEYQDNYYEVRFISKRHLDRLAAGAVTRDP